MARKTTVKDIEPINDTPRFMICPKCNKKYKADQFVKSSRFPGGYIPICKECMYEMTINAEGLDRQGLISFCQYVNLPFVQNDFEDAKSKYTNPQSPKKQLSYYLNIKMRQSSRQDMYFKDSIFSHIDDLDDTEINEEIVDLSENFTPGEVESAEERLTRERSEVKKKAELMNELKEKWGNFDSLEYLQRCEKLYQEIVQGGYVIKSGMHDLAVRNYCKLQVDWDIAQENKDYNAMRELKQPLKDARTDAKLNPNQFKPTDFQNAGANSFGEIAAMVSRRDGFIPLPMKYFKQPNDVLDFLMYELINYDRHILGMPEVEYQEIWQLYINQINEFNEKYNADIENGDMGDLDPSTKGKKKEWTIL